MPERRNSASSGQKELTLTRILDAPRELVFKAWTDPKLMSKWWGPHMFTIPVCELDVRPGGAILIHMKGPDGVIYPMPGVFDEVVRPERLAFTATPLVDKSGNVLLEVRTLVTFADQNGKTKLTVKNVVTKSSPEAKFALDGMDAGWAQTLERLESFLGSSKK